MEKDIKILERYLEKNDISKASFNRFRFLKALESLLKDYKDLHLAYELYKSKCDKWEEENEKYLIKLTDEEYKRVIENAQKDYIPISVIQNKIDEIKQDKNCKYYDMFLETRDIEETINILQELLEERKKQNEL